MDAREEFGMRIDWDLLALIFAAALAVVCIITPASGGTLKHEFRLMPMPERNPIRDVYGVTVKEKAERPDAVYVDVDVFVTDKLRKPQ